MVDIREISTAVMMELARMWPEAKIGDGLFDRVPGAEPFGGQPYDVDRIQPLHEKVLDADAHLLRKIEERKPL